MPGDLGKGGWQCGTAVTAVLEEGIVRELTAQRWEGERGLGGVGRGKAGAEGWAGSEGR